MIDGRRPFEATDDISVYSFIGNAGSVGGEARNPCCARQIGICRRKRWRHRGEAADFAWQHRPMSDADILEAAPSVGDDRGTCCVSWMIQALSPNNRAERALRGAVIARKVSHCSKNAGGADAFSAFTRIRTLARNGGEIGLCSVFRALRLNPSSQHERPHVPVQAPSFGNHYDRIQYAWTRAVHPSIPTTHADRARGGPHSRIPRRVFVQDDRWQTPFEATHIQLHRKCCTSTDWICRRRGGPGSTGSIVTIRPAPLRPEVGRSHETYGDLRALRREHPRLSCPTQPRHHAGVFVWGLPFLLSTTAEGHAERRYEPRRSK